MFPTHFQESQTRYAPSAVSLRTWLGLCLLVQVTFVFAEPKLVYQSLPELLQQGTSAFQAGDYPIAAQSFLSIQRDYSEEPSWRQGSLPRKILPLSGFASFRAQRFEDSLLAFDLFLKDFAEDSEQESLALFLKAQALEKTDRSKEALATYQVFTDRCASPSLKGLAKIKMAHLQFDSGNTALAIATLQSATEDQNSTRVATQATLAAIRYAIKSEDFATADELLFGRHWNVDTMPEIAMLNFSAIELAEKHIAANNPQKALQAYQLVLPHKLLIAEQRAKMTSLKNHYLSKRDSLTIQQSLWDDFYKQFISNLERQLQALEQSEDYTHSIQLRKALCFLDLNRPIEAALLAQSLINQNTQQASAYKIWIRSVRQLGQHTHAIQIAKTFLKQFPEDDSVDEILYEIGISQLDLERYPSAIESFQLLSSSSSDESLKNAASFQLGLCLALSNDYSKASQVFQTLSTQPNIDLHLQGQAELWVGLCAFHQHDFEDSLQQFNRVSYSQLPLTIRIESQFRRITCLYPLGDMDSAIDASQVFLKSYPNHIRSPEIQTLMGDIYLEQGRLLQAIEIYQKISPSFPELYLHATLGASSAHQELSQITEAQNTLDRALATLKDPKRLGRLYLARISLFDNPTRKSDFLEKWIQTHGNQKEASRALDLLASYDSLKDDDAWIDRAIKDAIANRQLTLVSRLILSKALKLKSLGHRYQADATLLQIQDHVATEDLPPECLAYLGLALVRIDSTEGVTLLQNFVADHSGSELLPTAQYGLGYAAYEKRETLKATAWLTLATNSFHTFPQYVDAKILLSKALSSNDEYEQSDTLLNQLLADRATPAKRKAETLNLLAENKTAIGFPKQAIAYYQRSYALYPAFPTTAIEAYLKSATQFIAIEDYEAAQRSCQELLKRYPKLEAEQKRQAETILESLASRATPPLATRQP